METTSCKQFSRQTDESIFTRNNRKVHATTTVYLLRPPRPLSSHRPWITVSQETTASSAATTTTTAVFRHPLTSKPHSFNLPHNLDLSQLHPSSLAVSHHLAAAPATFDTLLTHPTRFNTTTLFALYDGGLLRGRLPITGKWLKLSCARVERFDDITRYKGKVHAFDREGRVYHLSPILQSHNFDIYESLITRPVTPGLGQFGWRKRVVVDGNDKMYLVVRKAETFLQVYQQVERGKAISWEEVKEFNGNRVLFITRDYYFFRRVSRKFPGRQYRNCIVFTEGAFPSYGYGCWEFTRFPSKLGFQCSSSEENVAVFRLSDQRFGKEGENGDFPKIDWSPPSWIYDALSVPDTDFQSHSLSESLSIPGSELEEDKGLDSDRKDEKNEEVQSALKDSKSKDEEDGKMQCDFNTQEKEDIEMHVNASTEGGASLQEDLCHVSPSLFRPESGTIDTQTPSFSVTEKEITKTLLSLSGGNTVTEEETLRRNITELVPRACTAFAATNHGRDSPATAKFEGFEIRPDLVSTLQKIWLKHGNIIEQSIFRNCDIIARALESLATMVRILVENTAQSLSDSQVEYLVSTLSDLRCMRFKVDWLIASVEKAEKLQKSKPLLESLNHLSQLRSQAKKRRVILLDELTKLDVEENKREEEITKVSMMIPFCGQVKFDEPLGSGLI